MCSGQSNMEFSVAEMFDSERTIDSAGIPGIRLFATQKNASEVRLNDLVDTQYPEGWVESSTTNVCGSEYSDNRTAFCGPHCGPSAVVKTFRRNTWGYFSAVCFVHGLQMLRATGRPQGLLESCWGGTRIETWSSKEAMATCGAAKPQDGSHFTGMIAPLVRLPIRGAIWYQGEANAKQGNDYDCQLRSMIKDWRARWHRSQNFTFGVAQLAPAGDSSGEVLRWSQRSVATSLPGAYMSVATDLYDTIVRVALCTSAIKPLLDVASRSAPSLLKAVVVFGAAQCLMASLSQHRRLTPTLRSNLTAVSCR